MPACPLAQSTHHFKSFDGRIGRLQGFEPAHWPDQLFQLAVIDLNDVVQIFDLAMLSVLWAFALRLQLGNGHAIGGSLIGIDRIGLSPVFQPLKALPRNRFAALVLRVVGR